jgi:hypothetical protein
MKIFSKYIGGLHFFKQRTNLFSFKPNFLKFQINFFCLKKDDVDIETVINKLDSPNKIYEFFNIYYDTMPENDIAKLVKFFQKNYDLLELSDSKEMRTFIRNIFEISDNIKDVSNISVIIEFLIESLPVDTTNFIIALDKFIQKNFQLLLENNFKILTKYFSHLKTDVEKYYEVSWEFLSSSLEKHIEKYQFWDVIQILNDFLTMRHLNDQNLNLFTKVVTNKFKELSQLSYEEDSEEKLNISQSFYILKSLQKQLSEQKKDISKVSFTEENMTNISKILSITEEILKASGENDLERIYEEMTLEDKFRKDEYERFVKETFEKEELARRFNLKRGV